MAHTRVVQYLLPFDRRPEESLREHLLRLAGRTREGSVSLTGRGRYGSAQLARDVLEILDRLERLEAGAAAAGGERRRS